MSRWLRLLILLIVLGVAGMVQSQDEPNFGLAPREAQFFRDAMQTTRTSSSFQLTLNGNLTVTSGDQTMRVILNGGGTVLPQDPVGFDLTIMARTEEIPEVPKRFKVELRLVAGVLYLRGTNMETNEVGEWQAQPTDQLGSALLNLVNAPAADFSSVYQALGAVQWADFIRMNRPNVLPRYVAELQFRELFLSPAFSAVLRELLAVTAPETDYTPAQLSAVTTLFNGMFNQPQLGAEFIFDVNDRRLRRFNLGLNVNVDPTAFDPNSTPLTVTFDVDVRVSRYNEPFQVVAPDAVVAATPQPPVVPPLPGKVLFPDLPIRIFLSDNLPFELVYYANGPETISIYVTSLPANEEELDTTLEVFTAADESLAYNDDLEDTSDAGIEDLKLPGPGAYRIQLDTFVGNATGAVEVRLVRIAP